MYKITWDLFESKISGTEIYTESSATTCTFREDGELILGGFSDGMIRVI